MFTFIVVGVIGLALLGLSFLFGELFDLADGVLSGTGIGAGLTIFGAVGVLTYRGGSLTGPILWSALAGIAMMIIIQVAIKRLRESEDGVRSSVFFFNDAATTEIYTSRGEVSLDDSSELERRMAWANSPIAEGTRIVVRAQTGSRVRVEPVPTAASPDQTFAPPTDLT